MSEIDDTSNLPCDINRYFFISRPAEEQQSTGLKRKSQLCKNKAKRS